MNAPCTQHHSLNAPENLGDPTTFQRLLDEETVPVPEFLRPAPPAGLGDADMAVSRYFSAGGEERPVRRNGG